MVLVTGLTLNVLKTVRIGTSVLQGFGLLLAIFRLSFRFAIRRLWWEDFWAFITFFFALVYLTGTWIFTTQEATLTSVIGNLMFIFSFTMVIWPARLSILFSVIRIGYPSQRLRYLTYGMAMLFLAMFLSFLGAKLWYYFHDLSWIERPSLYNKPSLPLKRSLVIYQLVIDCLADAILIALPIRLLWNVKLQRKQRRMFFLIFASSSIVTVGSLFRAICQIANIYPVLLVALDVEAAFSSIMCNMLVFVTCIYRFRHASSPSSSEESESDESDDDFTTRRRPQTTAMLTTHVELGGTGYSSNVTSTGQTSTGQEECSGVTSDNRDRSAGASIQEK